MQQRQQIQQKSRLGSLLIEKGLITGKQLDQALIQQAQTNQRLGEVLIQNLWISERQLQRALKRQSRYRLVAAVTAILIGPFQPFIASANAAQDNTVMAEQTVNSRLAMTALSADEMSQVTGQGVNVPYEQMIDIVNNSLNQNDDVSMRTLESFAKNWFPGINLFDAQMEISGLEYEPGPRTTINADGSLDIQMPTRIGQIAFRNVQVAGAQGSHLGDVLIRDVQFGPNTSVKIYVR